MTAVEPTSDSAVYAAGYNAGIAGAYDPPECPHPPGHAATCWLEAFADGQNDQFAADAVLARFED